MTHGPEAAPSGRDGRAGEAAVPEPRRESTSENLRPVVPPLPGPPPRPRVFDEPGILGLSRRSRSRVGSRLFTLFFVLVFTVIVVQMVAAILDKSW